LECTTQPGDILFVPHGWWHFVINLDEWNIAITHNYVSRSNLCNVLRFLREKRDQVSGCRDRIESIKPEHLYEEFVQSLQQRYPQWLQQALDVPDWTCRAWKKSVRNDEKTIHENASSVVTSKSTITTTSIMQKAKSNGDNTSFSFAFDA
jgi:ribosomal protein L16 Arg81 hydroxylase